MELVIKETLEKLLEVMGIPFSGVKIEKDGESSYYVQIETSNSNLLIGWHGETISSLQHMMKCLLWKQKTDIKAQIIVDFVKSYFNSQIYENFCIYSDQVED